MLKCLVIWYVGVLYNFSVSKNVRYGKLYYNAVHTISKCAGSAKAPENAEDLQRTDFTILRAEFASMEQLRGTENL